MSKVITVDMTGVNAGGPPPEGDYSVVVTEVTEEESSSSGKPYLKWKFKIKSGEAEGSTLYHNTTLQKHALFNLKNVLASIKVPCPNSVLRLNLDELKSKSCCVTVKHEMYDGKPRARITSFFPDQAASAVADDAEDEM